MFIYVCVCVKNLMEKGPLPTIGTSVPERSQKKFDNLGIFEARETLVYNLYDSFLFLIMQSKMACI